MLGCLLTDPLRIRHTNASPVEMLAHAMGLSLRCNAPFVATWLALIGSNAVYACTLSIYRPSRGKEMTVSVLGVTTTVMLPASIGIND